MNQNLTIQQTNNKYVMHTYLPEILLTKGKGVFVWDDKGNKYLDFTSGIGVCNLGHCPATVSNAIAKQSETLVHVSNLFMNNQQPLLAKILIDNFGGGVAFFANSGAEANEGLIKLARKWGSDKGKYKIISMENSFHGRTLSTLSATGRDKYREGFAPDMPGFIHTPFNDFDAIEKAIDNETVAILIEPIQGEGGVIPADKDFLLKVRELCNEKDILLLFDEVQCGIGRTGVFYAHQNYGVIPDAMALAKGLGNGFPIGALLTTAKYANVLVPGTHASTFGGNPLACAAAIATTETILNDGVLENCQKLGDYFFSKLKEMQKEIPAIKEVRGKGLMIGIVLDKPLGDLLKLLQKEGLLALPAGETVLRLLPPLVITKEEADIGLNIILKILGEKNA